MSPGITSQSFRSWRPEESYHGIGLALISDEKFGGESPFVGDFMILKGFSDCCKLPVIFHGCFGEVSIKIDGGKGFRELAMHFAAYI